MPSNTIYGVRHEEYWSCRAEPCVSHPIHADIIVAKACIFPHVPAQRMVLHVVATRGEAGDLRSHIESLSHSCDAAFMRRTYILFEVIRES